MKLIKKIAAMLFAFAMVFSMTGVVQADETTDGSITINNAIEGQTYTIYKILDLESYDGNNYSYKAESGWDEFITGAGKSYLKTNNGYVEFVGTEADMPAFAKSALKFAKDKGLKKIASKTADATNTVTFGTLSLGYYLIDSSTGALCSLDTTRPTATVQEKNSVPTVDKTIIDSNNTTKKNSANIGDKVLFKTTIDVEKGAENYVLHDKMDAGLTFDSIYSVQAHQPSPVLGTDCILQTKNLGDDCTFHLVFTQEYLNNLTDSHEIDVVYGATVNENAKINQANTNQTWLTYGDNKKKSNVDETQTFSFGIPVFKYTGLTKTGLADAQFKLYNDKACKDEVKLTKADDHTYRVDPNGNATMVSPIDGKFNVNGLKAGTYYLKEMAAPKEYNKLANPITVTIDNDGKITADGETTTEVGVENKSGTLLPSTGGMGTTLIYLAGIVLVVLSGYVLISKRRASTK